MPREFKPIYRTKVDDIYICVDKVITPCKCIVTDCKETDCYDIQFEKPEGLSFMGGTFCKRHLIHIFNITSTFEVESEEVVPVNLQKSTEEATKEFKELLESGYYESHGIADD